MKDPLSFGSYKEDLFSALLSTEPEKKLMDYIHKLSKKGHDKKYIYELFLVFLQEIQIDPRTKYEEELFDILSHLMDGFTSWSKQDKILPNEPDVG